MATIYTHSVAGLALAKLLTARRFPASFWALAGLLPVVPDFDTFALTPYGSIWGHRGFTHSLLFAAAVALPAAALTFRYYGMRFGRSSGCSSSSRPRTP